MLIEERQRMLEGIVQGEARILTASLTVKQIFSDYAGFRENVMDTNKTRVNKIWISTS